MATGARILFRRIVAQLLLLGACGAARAADGWSTLDQATAVSVADVALSQLDAR